jgi:hypothetical protein
MLQVIAALALVLAFLGPVLEAFAEDDLGRPDHDALTAGRRLRES